MTDENSLININEMTPTQVASICDHTFLNRSEAYKDKAKKGESPVRLREQAFQTFLEETIANQMKIPYAVCVRPEDVERTSIFLDDDGYRDVLVASVVGFPDGSLYDTQFKVAETDLAITSGAEEIDMVLNYDRLRKEDRTYISHDIDNVVNVANQTNAKVKLILETSELTPEQIAQACQIADNLGVDFVKTSTGFGAYGARAEDLYIMRENFSRGIKISGGVNLENYKELLAAASGRNDGQIELDPLRIRIGESSLLSKL